MSTARALTILNRFPLYIAAGDAGKRFGPAVAGLADGLEVLTRQVGAVRVTHRLADVPTTADLLAVAGLHGLTAAAVEPVLVRLRALAAAAAAEPSDQEVLAALLGLPVTTLATLGDAGGELAGRSARHRPSLRLRRSVVTSAVDAHRLGNATPTALLTAAAGYLGLAVEEVFHAPDRWWHLARCRDRLRLELPPRPPDPGGPVPPEPPDLTPLPDVLGLEENPFHAADLEPVARRHAQRFRVLRGGLQDVDVTVRVRGIGTRTVRPMVVHVDTGRGLVYEGDVPDSAELQFRASGQVSLDGTEVTGSAWAFAGAVFASATEELRQRDFCFAGTAAPEAAPAESEEPGSAAGPVARFVVTTPLADALEPTAAFPHGAATVGPLRLPVGQSHWNSFVRVAHVGAGPTAPAVPRTSAGRYDASVFADAAGPLEPSLAVGFAWEEREPFAVRIVVPRRFAILDDEPGTGLRQPLRLLLDRHRAAGVDLSVDYADPRWTLGTGVLRETTDEPLGTVLAGTELWPDGTPQPT
ncbi:MAG: hypothetical protein LC635_00555 [Pseudonocardiaceae bacterium]|nr:hypothetical protein [Pseudonocardiaceae bacterium]